MHTNSCALHHFHDGGRDSTSTGRWHGSSFRSEHKAGEASSVKQQLATAVLARERAQMEAEDLRSASFAPYTTRDFITLESGVQQVVGEAVPVHLPSHISFLVG